MWNISRLTNNTGGDVFWSDGQPISTERGPQGNSYTLIAAACNGYIQMTDIGAVQNVYGVRVNGRPWYYQDPGSMDLTINANGSFAVSGGGVGSGEGGTMIPLSPTAWMSNRAPQIGPKMLRQVALPGTHDSGTYGINPLSGVAHDTMPPWLDLIYLGGPLAAAGMAMVAMFCKAQDQTIEQQLTAGIRYFDLRVCLKGGSEPWIAHGMWSVPVSDVLSQVKSFITQYPQEIVLLDFKLFYDMTAEAHEALAASIISTLGEAALAPNTLGNNVTVSELWSSKYHAIVFYADATTVAGNNNKFWPESAIDSPWPQTSDLETLHTSLASELPNIRGTFFVLQGVLTPDGGTVAKALIPIVNYPGSLYELAKEVSPAVTNWIQDEWSAQGLNIVIVDWHEVCPLVAILCTMNAA